MQTEQGMEASPQRPRPELAREIGNRKGENLADRGRQE
jgi:hypothetical protein